MTEQAHPEWEASYTRDRPAPWDIGRPQPHHPPQHLLNLRPAGEHSSSPGLPGEWGNPRLRDRT